MNNDGLDADCDTQRTTQTKNDTIPAGPSDEVEDDVPTLRNVTIPSWAAEVAPENAGR
jgi:hypothetical protein